MADLDVKINTALWGKVKKSIEEHLQKDENITDVTVKLRIKESGKAYLKNYLQINLTI